MEEREENPIAYLEQLDQLSIQTKVQILHQR